MWRRRARGIFLYLGKKRIVKIAAARILSEGMLLSTGTAARAETLGAGGNGVLQSLEETAGSRYRGRSGTASGAEGNAVIGSAKCSGTTAGGSDGCPSGRGGTPVCAPAYMESEVGVMSF